MNIEPSADLRMLAHSLAELASALEAEGFERHEVITLLSHWIAAAAGAARD